MPATPRSRSPLALLILMLLLIAQPSMLAVATAAPGSKAGSPGEGRQEKIFRGTDLDAIPRAIAGGGPSNDAFAGAEPIGSLPFSATGDTSSASREAEEPDTCGEAEIGATVWYRFAPTTDVSVAASTIESDFDTILAVYEGMALDDLALVTCNDDAGAGLHSSVGFWARGGSTYYLQLGGYYGDTGSLRLAVRAASSISGTVTTETGESLEGICVASYGDGGSFAEASTDADGEYSLGGVEPGSVSVYFSDCNEPARYVGEWYDDQRFYQSADQILVGDGEDVSGIDAALSLGGSVSGQVTDEQGAPIPDVCVEVLPTTVDTWGDAVTDELGRYAVGGLDPDDYKVAFYDCGAEGTYEEEWYQDKTSYFDADAIPVASGVVSEIDAALSERPISSIGGTVTQGDGVPLEGACVTAYRGTSAEGFAETQEDGSYFLPIDPGTYRVLFSDCFSRELVSEWYSDRPSYQSADLLSVEDEQFVGGIDAELTAGGITLQPTNGATAVAESGATDTYTVVLDNPPLGWVRVDPSSGEDVTTYPAALDFGPANWNVPQQVLVRAVDDELIEGSEVAQIGHYVTSEGGGWDGQAPPLLAVQVADDDQDIAGSLLTSRGPDSASIDHQVELSGWLRDKQTGSPLPGRMLTFKLERPDGTVLRQGAGVTDAEGIGRATVDTALDPGSYIVRIGFAGDASHPAKEVTSGIELRLRPSSMELASPGIITMYDDVDLRFRLTDVLTGEPITDAAVFISMGEEGFNDETFWVSTDDAGWATLPYRMMRPPGLYEIWGMYAGDERQAPVFVRNLFRVEESACQMLVQDAGGIRGGTITITTRVFDLGARAFEPLAGAPVVFSVLGRTIPAVSAADGSASASLLLNAEPGSYPLSVTFPGSAGYGPCADAGTLEIRWERTFVDQSGAGTVYLNPSTKEFRVVHAGYVSPIWSDPSMQSSSLPDGQQAWSVAYLSADATVRGTLLSGGSFALAGRTPGGAFVLRRL